MKTLIAVLVWCVLLLVLCWPLALLGLVLWPIAWVISLPFRLVGITFSALFAFPHASLMLPACVLGWGGEATPTRDVDAHRSTPRPLGFVYVQSPA